MIKTIDTHIIKVDGYTKDGKMNLFLVFAGTTETHYVTPCLGFWSDNPQDMQEVDLINQVLGNIGPLWYSMLIGQEVRLMVDSDSAARNEFSIKTLAVGHKENDENDETESFDDDQFVLLNSGLPIMTQAEAHRRILHPGIG